MSINNNDLTIFSMLLPKANQRRRSGYAISGHLWMHYCNAFRRRFFTHSVFAKYINTMDLSYIIKIDSVYVDAATRQRCNRLYSTW